MQKILKKRVLRDLKSNAFRYFALSFLIVLGMYLIVSIVGSADTVVIRVNELSKENKLEDGEFSVFVPLTDAQEMELIEKGVNLEKMFSLDFILEDKSTIRVFKNRKSINLLSLDKGRAAENKGEAVIEKRYSQENALDIGDAITIAGQSLLIVGIGTVPDYDAVYKELSDSSVDSRQFGLAFVNEEQYNLLLKSGKSAKSEQYTYSYIHNQKISDEKLKEYLKELEFSPDAAPDKYFREYWEKTGGQREDILDGVNELSEGAGELENALKELDENSDALNNGAGEILDSFIEEANEGLSQYGLSEKLDENNFEAVLENMLEGSDNGLFNLKIRSVLRQLRELKQYKDGISKYTDGVEKTRDGAGELKHGIKKLKENTDKLIEEYFDVEAHNLISFIKAEDNPRIKASAEDQRINKIGGLIAGIIVIILFTYVLSVFVVHSIEKESGIIGTLYALGAKKNDILIHYLTLPLLITFVSGVIGTILGFSKYGTAVQLADCYDYFSIPRLQTVYPVYLIIYGAVMPPVVSAIVNCLVINKRLSRPVLKLIKNEQGKNKINNINLGDMRFVKRFQIRQMLREARTGLTVIFGMFIAMVIMMLGLNCYAMCVNISTESRNDTKFEYMYMYKYPTDEVIDGAEACYIETLTKEIYGNDLEITVVGIDKENPYFDVNAAEGKNRIVVSSALSQKYNLFKGDKLIASTDDKDIDYAFTIEGVTQYSAGLYAFMDIDSMRELFGKSDSYYNTVLSDKQLAIEPERLYSVVTRSDIIKASDVFINQMSSFIMVLISISALIFCVVMYLMMKVMIDRSAFGISLVKIFGYRTKEIRRLYLNGNFYIVAAGAAICIPLSKWVMDLCYPVMVSNISSGMNLSFPRQLYAIIYLSVIILYFIINQLLIGKLKKIPLTEVLKARE